MDAPHGPKRLGTIRRVEIREWFYQSAAKPSGKYPEIEPPRSAAAAAGAATAAATATAAVAAATATCLPRRPATRTWAPTEREREPLCSTLTGEAARAAGGRG